MPASKLLNTWIAESESWQSYIDFRLPEDVRADYSFLPRSSDFYLSLMSRAFELLNGIDNTAGELKDRSEDKEELLAIAKGLEIFSIEYKRDFFSGINSSNNVLYAATLYYLSNFSASAWILSNIYSFKFYSEDVPLFVSNFLKRKLDKTNKYDASLEKFLQTGDTLFLDTLINEVQMQKEIAFDEDADMYLSTTLAEKILLKFRNDNVWTDLLKVNKDTAHWREFVNQSIFKKVPIWSFFPSQKIAIEKGVLNGETCTLQMPTSAGKTSISELIIYNEYRKNPKCKILYLAPFRALASELKQSLAVHLGRLGIKSKTIYGGNIPTVEERTSILDINLLISTPEKFMAIEDVIAGINREFSTIICDEGHLLDDSSRGLSYELLLSRLKENSEANRRFIFISAIIPNISTVNSWLGGTDDTLMSSDYRPTELEYAFLYKMDSRGSAFNLNVNPLKPRPHNYQLYKYLAGDDITIRNQDNGKIEKITSKKGYQLLLR